LHQLLLLFNSAAFHHFDVVRWHGGLSWVVEKKIRL
jgi:hypothetical protein